MIRNVEFSEISDNRYYRLDDLCKVDTSDCKNCHECCIGMDDTLILDPIDIFHISIVMEIDPEQLLGKCIELSNKNDLIIPHMMFNSSSSRCYFLSEEGRCKIHPYRPGICHLFPLGRIYHDSRFDYFLQTNQCKKKNLIKIKVKKWIGFENINEYEKYILKWHDFLKKIQEKIRTETPDKSKLYEWNLFILKWFYFKRYMKNYNEEKPLKEMDMEFYLEFYERLGYAEEVFDISSHES